MQRTVKRDYWLISGLLFFFFFSWSSSYSLFSIWLHQVIGLNGAQTGYVFAANAIAALLIQPFYGALQDKPVFIVSLVHTRLIRALDKSK